MINPYVVTVLSTGLIYYIIGWIMLKYPPRKINHLYGYRTPGSMKSQERWDFAQEFSSKLLQTLGAVLILLSIPGLFQSISPGPGTFAGTFIVIASVIILIVKTESALKQKFPEK